MGGRSFNFRGYSNVQGVTRVGLENQMVNSFVQGVTRVGLENQMVNIQNIHLLS